MLRKSHYNKTFTIYLNGQIENISRIEGEKVASFISHSEESHKGGLLEKILKDVMKNKKNELENFYGYEKFSFEVLTHEVPRSENFKKI
jgi:hypothetical protein